MYHSHSWTDYIDQSLVSDGIWGGEEEEGEGDVEEGERGYDRCAGD